MLRKVDMSKVRTMAPSVGLSSVGPLKPIIYLLKP